MKFKAAIMYFTDEPIHRRLKSYPMRSFSFKIRFGGLPNFVNSFYIAFLKFPNKKF